MQDSTEQDGGFAEAEQPDGPQRRCIVTGTVRPKAELLRLVIGPDETVVPDLDRTLPGRGIWLSPARNVVNTAMAKRLFSRAARRPVVAPDDLADRIAALLTRRCLDAIGLARRAGQAVAGFEKVKAELAKGAVAVLVEARDASPDGRGKIRALASGLAVIDLFDSAELGAVFGRDVAVHVCLAPGRLARRLRDEAAMLAGFRCTEPNA